MSTAAKLILCDHVTIEFEEYTGIDYKEVSSFWIKNALGQRVYFKTRSREIAQYTSDYLYGDGHYKVSSGKMGKNSGTNTVRASLNSKSRAGSRPMK
jgi:hypothetical protein